MLHVLANSIFINLHVFRAKVRDQLMVLVAHHHIEQYFTGGSSNGCKLVRRR
jgi:hypothetical protein